MFPQLLLQALMQSQQQPQNDKALSQGQESSTPAAPAPSTASDLSVAVTKKTSPDDLEPLATSFLRGFMDQNSQRGELPVQSFDQQFRQSVSPAREMLANALMGMGSSMTGQKFRSLREQQYEEFQNQQKQAFQQQQLQQQMKQHVAQISQAVWQNRQEDTLKTDIENARIGQKNVELGQKKDEFAAKYGIDFAKFQLAMEEFKLNQQKASETQRHNLTGETKVTNPNYQQALNETLATYQAKGSNLQDPTIRPKFLADVSERRKELDAFAAALKEKETTTKPKTTLVFVPGANGQMTAREVGAGSTVPEGTVTPSGMSSLNVPTAATRTMSEKAPRVVYFTDRINQLLNDNEKQLGPLKGRMAEFQTGKVGLPNRGAAQMRTDLGLLQTALMNMHVGARGGSEIMAHFGNLLGGLKADPENTRAVLSEIKAYAEQVAQEGRVKSAQEVKPVATHRYNPSTGKIEELR